MNSKDERKDKPTSPSAVKDRFFTKHKRTLSTSRSTPSFPDLINKAISKETSGVAEAELSSAMRRGSSSQTVNERMEDKPNKKTATRERRHSYTSFLNAKSKQTITSAKLSEIKINVKSTNLNSNLAGITEGKKGHRPRSYSEIAPNIHHVDRAPPVAITNKTPSYEYYGFVMYLISFVAFGIYLIWAYVPDEILHSLGITYYPNRYWALAMPVWIMTFVWFVFISFMTINMMNTPSFDSYMALTDEHANVMNIEKELTANRPSDGIPELHDMPIGLVNAFLYQSDLQSSTSHHFLNQVEMEELITLRQRQK